MMFESPVKESIYIYVEVSSARNRSRNEKNKQKNEKCLSFQLPTYVHTVQMNHPRALSGFLDLTYLPTYLTCAYICTW